MSFPLEKELFQRVLEVLQSNGIDYRFLVVVQSMGDFQKLEVLQMEYQGIRPVIRLFYNGINRSLFEECAYIDRQTIESRKPSLKDIYINGSVNRFHFGKLSILPDGRVKTNVNRPALGKLGKDTVHGMLLKELNSRNCWRKIRKYVTPCKSCIYESLCPPLSDYNTALRRNNLCTINEG